MNSNHTRKYERRAVSATAGARWLTISNIVRIGIQFVGIYALSRLLTPNDFGEMAVVFIITNLAGLIRDMGTGATVVQREDLSDDELDSVFLFNMIIGLGLFLILVVAARPLANGFGAPSVSPLIMICAAIFPVMSSAGVHQALLERDSRFFEIAVIEVSAYLVGLSAALLCAYRGFGVTSLAVQAIITAVASTSALWVRSSWRPLSLNKLAAVGAILPQAGTITAYNFFTYLSKNSDQILIGAALGATPLGFYSQAQKLTAYPQQLTALTAARALAPKMASLQTRPLELLQFTARTTAFMFTFCGFIVCTMVANLQNLVELLFGSQWSSLTQLLLYLLPSAVFNAMTSVIAAYLIATGAKSRLMALGLSTSTLFFGFVYAGSHWGVLGVCFAVLAHSIVAFLLSIGLARSLELARLFARAFAPSILTLIVSYYAGTAAAAKAITLEPLLLPLAVQSLAISTIAATLPFLALTFVLDRWTFWKLVDLTGIPNIFKSRLRFEE